MNERNEETRGPMPQQGYQQNIPQMGGPQDKNKPLVNLQVYQPPSKSKPPPQFDPFSIPQFMPMTGLVPLPYQQQAIMPIIKQYQINVSGPTDQHAELSRIYEDILPSKQFSNTFTTIGERIDICSFVRSVLVKGNDGDDISLEANGNNSLMSYVKFMELNPYNTYKFSNNPYKGLPEGMLIYRSCYPMRHDASEGTTTCARNAVGINIRIYRMSNKEYAVNKQDKSSYLQQDLWREVAYYEFVREKIVKQKISPNFVMMYAYFICEKCTIDFDQISIAKGKPTASVSQVLDVIEQKIVNDNEYQPIVVDGTEPKTMTYIPPVPTPNVTIITDKNANRTSMFPVVSNFTNNVNLDRSNATSIIVANPDAYARKAVVLLTEGSNYNMFGWASKTYVNNGNIRRMIQSGFYDEKIWMSVLFQIMSGLYVMQINQIMFSSFSLEDNIYIKDLTLQSTTTSGYWKYVIDGIEYYIPTFGYIVLIDSNYKDLDSQQNILSNIQNMSNNKRYKIHAKMFDETGVDDLCFETFKRIFNPNSFTNVFTNQGGNKPPENIIKLLDKISNETNSSNNKNIGHYIFKFMRQFMNNRIGTYLKKAEVDNIRPDVSDFKSGNMLINEIEHNTYKFVLFVKNTQDGKSIILTTDTNSTELVEKEVNTPSLANYSNVEPIVQNYKPNESPIDDNLLEKYQINKEN